MKTKCNSAQHINSNKHLIEFYNNSNSNNNNAISSEEGAQQGDPLGPLYFCLVFKGLLESLESELVLGYLDDVAVGDSAEMVLQDFILLESTAMHLGLEVERSKCEIIGHTDETRDMFTSQSIVLPETSSSTVIFLGSPMSARQHLDSILASKKQSCSD